MLSYKKGAINFSPKIATSIVHLVKNYSKEQSLETIRMLFSMIFEQDLMLLENVLATTKIDASLNKRRHFGAYYTPRVVADFMSEKALLMFLSSQLNRRLGSFEVLLAGSDREKVHALSLLQEVKILDPSVGAGAFLLSCAEILFNWQRRLQMALQPEKQLTSKTIKTTIIQKNLYGVDLLEEAVNLTKLQFFLWLIEDEYKSGDTSSQQLVEKAMNMQSNLCVGNSLIGIHELSNITSKKELEEFHYNDLQKRLKKIPFSKREYNKLRPFHWWLHWPEIIRNKGFDIILGNPPYLECKKMRNILEKHLYKRLFRTAYKLYDLAVLFIERGLHLLKPNGILVYLITNKFLSTDFGLRTREMLLEKTKIQLLVDISYLPIFQKTASYPIVIGVQKRTDKNEAQEENIAVYPKITELDALLKEDVKVLRIAQDEFAKLPNKQFILSEDFVHIEKLFQKKTPVFLGEKFQIYYRLLGFINWQKNLSRLTPQRTSPKDFYFVGTANISPFAVNLNKDLTLAKQRFKKYFLKYSPEIEYAWKIFSEPKILIKEVAHKLIAAYDPGIFANLTGVYLLLPKEKSDCKYFVALLNSKVLNFIYSTLFSNIHLAGGFLRYNGSYLKQLPVKAEINERSKQLLELLADYQILVKQMEYTYQTQITATLIEQLPVYQKLIDYLVYQQYFEGKSLSEYEDELSNLLIPLKLEDGEIKQLLEKKGSYRGKLAGKIKVINTSFQNLLEARIIDRIEKEVREEPLLQKILKNY
ncbi:MAG: Eco57I restriction-modification methylase domain-containing protein [Candidatus Heimdallarchaeota archaeon]|nr:Eco57I restriction-modification methylase domain-containing protein [Candidatus Heimdallarchaeota archaeon]